MSSAGASSVDRQTALSDIAALQPLRRIAASPSDNQILMLIALHVPLALAMNLSSYLGKLHCAATLALGVYWALKGNKSRVIQITAYIVGAEVLWRMTHGALLWEIGKYAVCLILITSMLAGRGLRLAVLPTLYFGVLAFSLPLTILGLSMERARQVISADMSGPFSLMIAASFFMATRLTKEQLRSWMLVAITPLSGILANAWYSMLTAENLTFHTDSNFVASGGFGPNQVSAILGLGAMLAVFIVKDSRQSLLRSVLILAVPVLLAQSMLTFSRSGLYLAVGSLAVGASFLLRQRGERFSMLMIGGVAFLIIWFIIFPWLDGFTGGNLGKRFQDSDMSGRESLFMQEIEIWLSHPIVGIGPGMSGTIHVDYTTRSHTEFSRLLAEHGMCGILALGLLLLMVRRAMKRAPTLWHRAYVAAFMTWVTLFMCVSGMRLVAPSLLFALAIAKQVNVPNKQQGLSL